MFYPDVKPHISPSAFQAWHNQKSMFIRSYFLNQKTPQTSSMKAGKQIHALIEGGFIDVKNKFPFSEKQLITELPGGVRVLGIPDAHEEGAEKIASFVDYKTGKEDNWSHEKIVSDLKMRLTAWLVLQVNPNVEHVRSVIEWIGTRWDEEKKEIVPTGESACYECLFSAEELKDFTEIIFNTVDQINVAYEQFLETPRESLVSENDVVEYVSLQDQIDELQDKQKSIRSRIQDQLNIIGQESFDHPLGKFYFINKKQYEYPKDLTFLLEDGKKFTIAEGEDISLAMGAAMKNYQLNHDPVKISKSLSFRAKHKK